MKNSAKPRIAVMGGGTGMPVLLQGLKNLPIDITALVTVADDGGSSGKIREEFGIPAPGDIRNVINALSDADPLLLELFQHRFSTNNGLLGHSMGNLLLAALTSITGSFYEGIQEISRVFNVKGKIFPISDERISLYAEMEDGTFVYGESEIPLAKKKVKRLYLGPDFIQPLPAAVQAIKEADLIVISPGSLYTSILPNLIIPQIDAALIQSKARIVYVCNVMTQEGETTGFTASDHVKTIHAHLNHKIIDSIVVHNKPIEKSIRKSYAQENAEPVDYDMNNLKQMDLHIIEDDIIDYSKETVRHDTKKIARLLYKMITK